MEYKYKIGQLVHVSGEGHDNILYNAVGIITAQIPSRMFGKTVYRVYFEKIGYFVIEEYELKSLKG